MHRLSAVVLAALPVMANASCDWDSPGADRFTGSVPHAVDSYKDIPTEVRARLVQRVIAHDYDEIVTIRRDSIEGRSTYSSEIRDMHFGSSGKVCPIVSRSRWAQDDTQMGLVYCEDSTCVLVPTVCTNVSRIERIGAETPPVPPIEGLDALLPLPPSTMEPLSAVPDTPTGTFMQYGGPYGGGGFYGPTHGSGGGTHASGGGGTVFVPLPCDCCHVPTTPVPELPTYAIMALGLIGIVIRRSMR